MNQAQTNSLIWYSTETEIITFKQYVNGIVDANKGIQLSINIGDKYLKFNSGKEFGRYLNDNILTKGFDFIVANPIVQSSSTLKTMSFDIAQKGEIYKSTNIVSQCRKNNYRLISDKLDGKRLEVLNFLKSYNKIDFTSGEIINDQTIPPYRKSDITGRMSELDEMCYLKVIGERKNEVTGIKNAVYTIVSEEEREQLKKIKIENYYTRIKEIVQDRLKPISDETKRLLTQELKKVNTYLRRIK